MDEILSVPYCPLIDREQVRLLGGAAVVSEEAPAARVDIFPDGSAQFWASTQSIRAERYGPELERLEQRERALGDWFSRPRQLAWGAFYHSFPGFRSRMMHLEIPFALLLSQHGRRMSVRMRSGSLHPLELWFVWRRRPTKAHREALVERMERWHELARQGVTDEGRIGPIVGTKEGEKHLVVSVDWGEAGQDTINFLSIMARGYDMEVAELKGLLVGPEGGRLPDWQEEIAVPGEYRFYMEDL